MQSALYSAQIWPAPVSPWLLSMSKHKHLPKPLPLPTSSPSIHFPQPLYQSAALNMSILSAAAQFLDSSVSRYLNRIWQLNISWSVISNPSQSFATQPCSSFTALYFLPYMKLQKTLHRQITEYISVSLHYMPHHYCWILISTIKVKIKKTKVKEAPTTTGS